MKYNGVSFNPKVVASKSLSEFIREGLKRFWVSRNDIKAKTEDLKRVHELCVKEVRYGNDKSNAE